jgi:hypothetical protein
VTDLVEDTILAVVVGSRAYGLVTRDPTTTGGAGMHGHGPYSVLGL